MKQLLRILLLPLFFVQAAWSATPLELAAMLERQLLTGQAVEMQFALKGEKVTIKADMRTNAVRLETPTLMILSDGRTVWNYKKKAKQVTIDAISNSPNSPFSSPKDLFRFSENYDVKLVSQKSGKSTLQFIPNEKLKGLLKSAGAIESFELALTEKKGKVTIHSARAMNASGTVNAGKVTIKSVTATKKADFTFTPPRGASVVDLRE